MSEDFATHLPECDSTAESTKRRLLWLLIAVFVLGIVGQALGAILKMLAAPLWVDGGVVIFALLVTLKLVIETRRESAIVTQSTKRSSAKRAPRRRVEPSTLTERDLGGRRGIAFGGLIAFLVLFGVSANNRSHTAPMNKTSDLNQVGTMWLAEGSPGTVLFCGAESLHQAELHGLPTGPLQLHVSHRLSPWVIAVLTPNVDGAQSGIAVIEVLSKTKMRARVLFADGTELAMVLLRNE